MSDCGANVLAINSAACPERRRRRRRRDEYGIPGSANAGRFQYTGQAWLAELGLYYYKNRLYSPTLGRFLQTDPIGYGDGMNIYAYVGNDPVNFTDPLGLANQDIIVIGRRIQRDGGGGGGGGFWGGSIGGGGGGGGRYSEPSGPDIIVVGERPRRPENRPIVVTARRRRPPSFLFLAAAPEKLGPDGAEEKNALDCPTMVDIAAGIVLFGVSASTIPEGRHGKEILNAIGILKNLKAGMIGTGIGAVTLGGLSIAYYYERQRIVKFVCRGR